MSTITVLDSTTATDIPLGTPWVLGYTDGAVTGHNYAQMHQHLPEAQVIPVTVLGSNIDAAICDVEKGDATPEQAALWVRHKHERGRIPSDHAPMVYFAKANYAPVVAALHQQGILYVTHLFVADYDDKPTIPAGYTAKQYANEAQTGHHYDKSIMDQTWADFVMGIHPAFPLSFFHRTELRDVRDFMLNRANHKWPFTAHDEPIVVAAQRAIEQALAVK